MIAEVLLFGAPLLVRATVVHGGGEERLCARETVSPGRLRNRPIASAGGNSESSVMPTFLLSLTGAPQVRRFPGSEP